MEVTIIIAILLAVVLILVWKSKRDEKELLRKFHRKNEKEWGEIPDREYTREQIETIRKYYLANKGTYDVDDITWNDLDMDTIFMLLNNTHSSMGQDYLYAALRKLEMDDTKLNERERVISFFQNNKEARNKVQTEFRFMGRVEKFSLYQYINMANEIPKHNPIASIFMSVMMVASIVLIALSFFGVVSPAYGIVLFVCTLVNNLIHYFNRKAQIEKYFQVFMYIIRMLKNAKDLVKLDVPELKDYFDRIKELTKAFSDLEKGSFLVFFDSRKGQGSFWDLGLD